MTKKDRGIPGNALAEAAAFDRELVRIGKAVKQLESLCFGHAKEGFVVTYVNFRVTADEGEDVLAIGKACWDGEKVIAFHDGSSFADALVGFTNRFRNGQLKWKEDKPYVDRK